MNTREVDAGLWEVTDNGNGLLGFVYDNGAKCSMEKPVAYTAYLDWRDGTGEVIGTAKTFQGARKLIREYWAKRQD